MALSLTQTNNKLIIYRKQVFHEFVRENLFSPYMGTDITSIFRVIPDLDKGGKNGGEQINIPLMARLNAAAYSNGTLVGNEEALDNYGFRMWIDWARTGIAINNAEEQKSSIDLFAEARPMIVDWGKELQRDEICDGLYALPLRNRRRLVLARPMARGSTASCLMPPPRPSAIPGSPTIRTVF